MPFRVLLADENLAVQKLVELTLHKEGMEVISADNGLSALDLALKWPPDIILADYNLEGLSFRKFYQKVKEKESLKEIPVVLLVNSTEIYDPEEMKSLGVYLILKKPIDAEQLAGEVGGMMVPPEIPEKDPETEDTPSLSEHFSEQEESLKIEELLGWASPGNEESESEEKPESEEKTLPDLPEANAEEMFTLEELPSEQPADGIQGTDVSADSRDEQEVEALFSGPSFSDTPIELEEDLKENPLESRDEEEGLPEVPSVSGFTEESETAAGFTEGGETEIEFTGVGETEDIASEETLVSASFFEGFREEPEIEQESVVAPSGEETSESTEGIQIPEETSAFEEEKAGDEFSMPVISESSITSENAEIASSEELPPVSHDFSQDFELSQQDSEGPIEENADVKSPDSESSETEGRSAPSLPLVLQNENETIDRTVLDEAIKRSILESVERITWEVLPDLIRSTLSKDAMTATIEKVVWEVIPSLAEVEIKKEIKRLQAEED